MQSCESIMKLLKTKRLCMKTFYFAQHVAALVISVSLLVGSGTIITGQTIAGQTSDGSATKLSSSLRQPGPGVPSPSTQSLRVIIQLNAPPSEQLSAIL